VGQLGEEPKCWSCDGPLGLEYIKLVRTPEPAAFIPAPFQGVMSPPHIPVDRYCLKCGEAMRRALAAEAERQRSRWTAVDQEYVEHMTRRSQGREGLNG
jgi:hypothetical protein